MKKIIVLVGVIFLLFLIPTNSCNAQAYGIHYYYATIRTEGKKVIFVKVFRNRDRPGQVSVKQKLISNFNCKFPKENIFSCWIHGPYPNEEYAKYFFAQGRNKIKNSLSIAYPTCYYKKSNGKYSFYKEISYNYQKVGRGSFGYSELRDGLILTSKKNSSFILRYKIPKNIPAGTTLSLNFLIEKSAEDASLNILITDKKIIFGEDSKVFLVIFPVGKSVKYVTKVKIPKGYYLSIIGSSGSKSMRIRFKNSSFFKEKE